LHFPPSVDDWNLLPYVPPLLGVLFFRSRFEDCLPVASLPLVSSLPTERTPQPNPHRIALFSPPHSPPHHPPYPIPPSPLSFSLFPFFSSDKCARNGQLEGFPSFFQLKNLLPSPSIFPLTPPPPSPPPSSFYFVPPRHTSVSFTPHNRSNGLLPPPPFSPTAPPLPTFYPPPPPQDEPSFFFFHPPFSQTQNKPAHPISPPNPFSLCLSISRFSFPFLFPFSARRFVAGRSRAAIPSFPPLPPPSFPTPFWFFLWPLYPPFFPPFSPPDFNFERPEHPHPPHPRH